MEATASAETGSFAIGEKVQVPHTDKYYTAKILKAEYRDDGQWYYFLHYTGWNKKYDEWVEETGLARCPQGDGPAQQGVPPKKKQLQQQPQQPPQHMAPPGKYPKKRSLLELGQPEAVGAQLDIEPPAILKKIMIEDYESIVEDGKLVPLPRSPTVNELLQNYVQEAQEQRGSSESEEEVAHGLRSYFDKSLQVLLLYKPERRQAMQCMADGRVPSSIYGAEHFVRLFVKLPDLLSMSQVSEEQLAQVSAMVQDVMGWMAENVSKLFLRKDDYIDNSDAME